MNIVILDDYQDAVRKLACANKLEAYQAKVYTNNLSATMVSLLADFEVARQSALHNRQRAADACATHWNAVHASIGSFADGHSTL